MVEGILGEVEQKGLADRLAMRDERVVQTQILFQSHFSTG